ncbi:MAG: hypothetical protein ABJC89_04910 [Acidobacteriota bacterium]
MQNFLRAASRAGIALGIVAIGAGSIGQAQTASPRRGAPTDWSYSHIIGNRFGPDAGAAIDREWRTYNKQARRDQARASVAAAARLDWASPAMRKLKGAWKPGAAVAHLDWNLQTGGYGSVVGDPAKYSFDISAANCADVIYFTVNQAGSASAPNVIAITNPYSICPGNSTGTTPTVKFALRLTSGTATSSVPSLDGTILYVLESRAGSTILHAINVNKITTTPGTYNFATNVWTSVHTLLSAPIGTAATEQLFEITFAGVVNNSSSPYLDYANNQIFFGDAAGRVHRVLNTNLSTASHYTLKGFPVQCGTAQLTSPVFVTSPLNQLFVASANGFAYRIDMQTVPAGNYVPIGTTQAGTGNGVDGGLSAPVIDITNNKIVLTTGDAALLPGFKGIGEVGLMFGPGATPLSSQALGRSDNTLPTAPAFDDAFWSTNNGHAYATGNSTGGGDTFLIKIPYNGSFSAPSGYAALRHTGGDAEQPTTGVTEFLTASASANKDFLFVGAFGGAYLYMNRFLSNFGGTENSPTSYASSFGATAGTVPGGVTSGVVIDNRTTYQILTGLSTANIYFGTKGVTGSAFSRIIQLNQEF